MKGPIVVIDAANGIGRGVVQAAIHSGRPVIAVSQDVADLDVLRKHHAGADLTTVIGSIADEGSSEVLASALRELDRPLAGIVIANCAEPMRGRVLDKSALVLQQELESELLPHLAAARHLLPLLIASGRNGGYVIVGSPGSENPWVGYGYRSIAAAAVSMLVRVLHEEARTLGVRVQMLAISRPARTEQNRESACSGWPSADAIGGQALALIDQVEPRQAASAVVPFENNRHRASPGNAVESSPDSARAPELTSIAIEPALLAEMTSGYDSARSADPGADPEGQRQLDQAWVVLAPLFKSIRGEEGRK